MNLQATHLTAGSCAPRLEEPLQAPVRKAQRRTGLPGRAVTQEELRVRLPVHESGALDVIALGCLQQLLPFCVWRLPAKCWRTAICG